MHTIELVELAIGLLRQCGYRIRQESLGDTPSGACELRGQKWMFLDPTLSSLEQLQVLIDALEREPAPGRLAVPAPLEALLQVRRVA